MDEGLQCALRSHHFHPHRILHMLGEIRDLIPIMIQLWGHEVVQISLKVIGALTPVVHPFTIGDTRLRLSIHDGGL